MAWTKQQKATMAIACKAAGIGEEQRREMILRNFAHAHHGGRVTSTSPKLTAADFEQFMAVVEGYAGGSAANFPKGYWHRAAGQRAARLRHRVLRIDAALRAAGVFTADSLRKWIDARVPGSAGLTLDQLDYHGVLVVMLGTQSFAGQKGVAIDRDDTHDDAGEPTTAAASHAGTDAAATTEGIPDHADTTQR